MNFEVRRAVEKDLILAPSIVEEINYWARFRTTGVVGRTAAYIEDKIKEGKAFIAFSPTGEWVGFCYLEVWEHRRYVANSGLIIKPEYRKSGLAKKLKEVSFRFTRKTYPQAKIFSLTSKPSVMQINLALGYKSVSPQYLFEDSDFVNGCRDVVDYPDMTAKHKNDGNCFLMLFDPLAETQNKMLFDASPGVLMV